MQCKYSLIWHFPPSYLLLSALSALHFRFQSITMWKVFPAEAMLLLDPWPLLIVSTWNTQPISSLALNNSVELCSFHLFQEGFLISPIHRWVTHSLSMSIETVANFYHFSLPYYIIMTSWCLSCSKWGPHNFALQCLAQGIQCWIND